MLHPFISTPTVRVNHWAAITLSFATHTGLIALAVAPRVSTGGRGHQAVDRPYAAAPVRFVEVARAKPPAAGAAAKTALRATRPAQPSLRLGAFAPVELGSIAMPDVDAALTEVDLTGKITDSLDFPQANLADVIGNVLGPRPAAGAGGIYSADAVERVVLPFPDNPRPDYPSSLERAGIETNFVVHFVVDTTGHVDEASVEFPKTAHWLFVDAVRRALMRSRYLPAELAGRRVPQLVAQEFVFRVGR